MRLSDLDRMEFEFKVEDADLSKLAELLADVNIKETPWFDVSDKHGNSARYYREGQWIPCSDCEKRCSKWENLKTLQE